MSGRQKLQSDKLAGFILTMRNVNEQSVPASEPNGG